MLKHALVALALMFTAGTAVAKPAAKTGKAKIVAVVAAQINLNSATLEELKSLPGVGDAKAKAIIAHRTNAPFKTVEDVLSVKGIGKKTLAKWAGKVLVTAVKGAKPMKAGKPAAKGMKAMKPMQKKKSMKMKKK